MPRSLFESGHYSQSWVRPFYDQTAVWWGEESEIPDEDRDRAATIERLVGPAPLRVLELGAGSGNTAAACADRGYDVVAVELSPARAAQARRLVDVPRSGRLAVVEGNFYEVELDGRFDAVTYWDGFGVGSDEDHRRLLARIGQCWLADAGSALIDVASTTWAIRHAGEEVRLRPLPGVPGSVEMWRRFHWDAVASRWIDEWTPVEHPEESLQQTIRTYTPADFLLLLEGSGLRLTHLEVNGEKVNAWRPVIRRSGPLWKAYSYLVQLAPAPRA